MNKLYLKKLDEEDKNMWLKYAHEAHNPKKLSEIPESYFYERLEFIEKVKSKVPTNLNVYYMIDNDCIIGCIWIHSNPELAPKDKHDGSHISYFINPTKRGKGYGTEMLHLGVEKCMEEGLEEIIVSCYEENIGSSKVIENNCGKLISRKPCVLKKDKKLKTYKIDIENSLNNYCSKKSKPKIK